MLPCEANGDPPPKTRWRRIGPGFPPDGKLKNDLTEKFVSFVSVAKPVKWQNFKTAFCDLTEKLRADC